MVMVEPERPRIPEEIVSSLYPKTILDEVGRGLKEHFPYSEIQRERGILVVRGEQSVELRLREDKDKPLEQDTRGIPVHSLIFDNTHRQLFFFANSPREIPAPLSRWLLDVTGLFLGIDPQEPRIWVGFFRQLDQARNSGGGIIYPENRRGETLALIKTTLRNLATTGKPD